MKLDISNPSIKMSLSKMNYTYLVTDDVVGFNKLESDLRFERSHPFYNDWKDWKDIVFEYYSRRVTELSCIYNRGMGIIDNGQFSSLDRDNQHECARKCSDMLSCLGNPAAMDPVEVFQDRTIFSVREDCECYLTFDPKCKWQEHHLRNHLIAFNWAYFTKFGDCKRYNKYYRQLERVILSLPYKRLQKLTVEPFLYPERFQRTGKNVLRELYSCGHLDTFKTRDFAARAEMLKNFVCQQSGDTSQSGSVPAFSDEFFECGVRVVENLPFDKIMYMLFPRQQGLFSLTLNHSLPHEELNKFKDMMADINRSFLSGLQDTILGTGKTLMVMFAAAATISCLAKLATTVAYDVIMKILHLIYALLFGQRDSRFVEKSYQVTQQSGDDMTLPFLPAMILNYVIRPPKNILASVWENPNLDRIMRRIGYLGDPKIERGVDYLVNWFRSIIYRVRAWYCFEVLGITVPDDLNTESHAIVKWNEEVDNIVSAYYKNQYIWTDTTWSVVYGLYSRGLTMARTPAYAPWKTAIWRSVTQLGNLLEKFKLHNKDGQSIRNPPVTIYLYGGTGQGKSTLTYPLATEILHGIFKEEKSEVDLQRYWKSLIYMRSPEQEFWDGYENQLVTVFDDFNQQADSASNPNLELFEIIRSSNSFPYPLHMASIDQKANTAFTSKIIIVSSNMERPKTQSLNFPSALERRFDICVKVSRRSTELSREGKFDPKAYDFIQYDMQTGKEIGTIGYKELIYLSCKHYFDRRCFVNTVEDYINQVLTETPVQQGGDVAQQTEPWPRIPIVTTELPVVRKTIAWPKRLNFDLVSFAQNYVLTPSYQAYSRCKEYVFPEQDSFALLRRSTEYIKTQYDAMYVWWNDFRQRHPYVFGAMAIISLIITGLVFIKIFTMFTTRKVTAYSEKEIFGKPRNCTTCNPKVKAEAYAETVPLRPKFEGYSDVASPRPKFEAYSEVKPQVAKIEGACQQGVRDLNASEVLQSVIRRSLYKMYESSRGLPLGHVFFVRGRLCMMPRHYIDGLKNSLRNDPDAFVTFRSATLNRAFEYRIADMLREVRTYKSPSEDIIQPVTKDYMAVEIPSAHVHPDTVSFFCDKNSLSLVGTTEVVLPVMMNNNIRNSEKDMLILRYRKARNAITRVASLDIGDKERSFVRTVRDAWRYDADTEPTECGTPVIVRNSQICPGKICGFHIAGVQGTGEGFAVPFYKEDILELISLFPSSLNLYQKDTLNLGPVKEQGGQVPEGAEFVRLGTVQIPVAQPVKTKIWPSACYGNIKEPVTKPCALRPVEVDGQQFDPRKYRLQRLGNVPQAIGRDIVENAKRALIDEIAVVLSRRGVQSENIKPVYTFSEAVKGIDGELFVNSLKRTTSPGYPFIHQQGMKSRKDFFGDAEEYDITTPASQKLEQRVNEIIQDAKQGIVGEHIFMDTLKDERKPIHKAHKTRLFSAGPIDYLIACKQYFNGIVALLQHNRNACHISVGSNPYSEDWNQIVAELLRKSANMVAGDFEGFDASQNQQLLTAAGEVLIELSKRFCGSSAEDVQVMRVLMCSLTSSIHITGNEVYQWTHSLPSGHYLTAIINSIFVNLAFSCIWQIAFDRVSYMMARQFWEECGIVAYGDDHIVSIPDNRLSLFSQLTVPNLFRCIGLSYTMEDKDAVAEAPSRHITEISYLKRSFERTESGKWIGPLSLDTVLEAPMWVHQTPDISTQTCETLDWALKELSLHSEAIWERWAPVLIREQQRLGYFTRFIDWSETRICALGQEVRI